VFSRDGSRIVTAGADGNVFLYDAATGQVVLTLSGHSGVVRSASFSADAALVVSAGDDHTVRIWDARTGKQQLLLEDRAGGNGVRGAVFAPDGTRIFYAGGEGAARALPSRFDAYFTFGCQALKGLDLYSDVQSYCDR